MIVDNLVVFPDRAHHKRILHHEVRHLISEPFVYHLRGLAPVAILRCVLAVSDRDDGEGVIWVKPRLFDYDIVALLEADWLIVPAQLMR